MCLLVQEVLALQMLDQYSCCELCHFKYIVFDLIYLLLINKNDTTIWGRYDPPQNLIGWSNKL